MQSIKRPFMQFTDHQSKVKGTLKLLLRFIIKKAATNFIIKGKDQIRAKNANDFGFIAPPNLKM